MPNLSYKYSKLLTQCFWLIGIVCCLFSCQTRIDIAGNKHATVAAKWYALANYTQSDIINYGVSITASLGVELINEKQVFKLSNFKISNQVDRQNINLLRPVFEQKFICTPLCFQLLEYVNFSGEDGATLLDNFFSEHEFELFQFYGDMVLLNPLLKSLADKDPLLLSSYLQSLANKDIAFDTSKDFILFLEKALTTEAYESFVNNPVDIYAQYLQDYQTFPNASWSEVTDKENEGWLRDNVTSKELLAYNAHQTSEYLQPEYFWEAGSSLAPEDLWEAGSSLAPEDLWEVGSNLAPESFWQLDSKLTDSIELNILNPETNDEIVDSITLDQNRSSTTPLQLLEAAKGLPIEVGQNVCSYRENLFGLVMAVTSESIEVNILGQAKIIKDGVISPPKEGSLHDSSLELYFVPLIGKKTFPKSAVVRCFLN